MLYLKKTFNSAWEVSLESRLGCKGFLARPHKGVTRIFVRGGGAQLEGGMGIACGKAARGQLCWP